MKNVPLHERALLSAAIQAGTDAVQGRRALLVDDLWETGSTLRRVAEVLGQLGATEVRALVMTRTKGAIHRVRRRFTTDFSAARPGQKPSRHDDRDGLSDPRR
ncbi:MAG: phosphoribosyltransferase family protein [Acidobacteriota bacterium]